MKYKAFSLVKLKLGLQISLLRGVFDPCPYNHKRIFDNFVKNLHPSKPKAINNFFIFVVVDSYIPESYFNIPVIQ